MKLLRTLRLGLALLLAPGSLLLAQTTTPSEAVRKTVAPGSAGVLTSGFKVGSGSTVTVESGATLTVASGATVNFPDNAFAIGDVSGLQAALDGKQPLDATLTGLAATTFNTAGQVAYATGTDTFATVTTTSFGRSLWDDNDAAAGRTTLGAERQRSYNVLDYGAISDDGLNDTTAINAALEAARVAGGGVVVVPPGTYLLATSLVVGSNTTLEASGATFVMGTGNVPLLTNRALETTQRTVADAAISATSTTLTSATAAFTSADVGRAVVVAGADGAGMPLGATISAVTNSTTVTLDRAAVTTVSGASLKLYDFDQNIRIVGGYWKTTRAYTGSDNYNQFGVVFRRVAGLTTEGTTHEHTTTKYAVSVAQATDVVVSVVRFVNCISDGWHGLGPMVRVTIRDVSGHTGDDIVSFTALDFTNYTDVGGPITDVTVEGVRPTNNGAVKIVPGAGLTARNITFSDIDSATATAVSAIQDTATAPTTGGAIENLTVRNVRSRSATSLAEIVSLTCPTMKNIVIEDVQSTSFGANGRAIVIGSAAIVDGLAVRNMQLNLGTTADAIYCAGAITRGSITGSHLVLGSSGTFINLRSGGSIGELVVGNHHQNGGIGLYSEGTGTITSIWSNVRHVSTGALINQAANTAAHVIYWDNVRTSGLMFAAVSSGASATIFGANSGSDGTALFRSGSQSIRAIGSTLRVALTALTPSANDFVQDASTGKVNHYSGSAWANLTLAGNLTTSGANALTLTTTGTTNVTLPTSGTLLNTTGSGASLTALNADNISSGTLAAARGGAGTVNGIMKANGSGVVSAAVSGTDYAKVPLTATATLDFGSIAAAASEDLTVTVTGAVVGYSVSVGLPAAPAAGIVWDAFVSAADTVTIRATNITAGAVDPASATYRATVFVP